MNTVIRQNYSLDPDLLSDEEWSDYYTDAIKLRKKEMEDLTTIVANGVITVINQIYGRDNNTMDS